MHSALPVQVVKSNHVSDERRCLREERPSLFILLRIGFKGTGSSFFFFFLKELLLFRRVIPVQ